MKTRAELLAELEEKSHKNNNMDCTDDFPATLEPEGYDPYDNPAAHKRLPRAAPERRG